MMRYWMFGLCLFLLACGAGIAGADLTATQQLGKKLFFDNNLSTPPGQACAACHAPNTGFVGPDPNVNSHGGVYPGAVHTRFGNRKPPSAAYASFSPAFSKEGGFEGGMFWDGRARDTIAQAKGPFLNPLEQNNPDARAVVGKVLGSAYADAFKQVFTQWTAQQKSGHAASPITFDLKSDAFVEDAFQVIAEAIADYEASPEVNRFSSKYDAYLAGKTQLTAQERLGLDLFEGKANCAICHPSQPEDKTPALFTNFTYENLGLPKNPENPFYTMPAEFNPDGAKWVDPGLGGQPGLAAQRGKMKVPTLRNVGMKPSEGFVQAYGHNGVFKSLDQVVNFYNTRDLGGWAPPEVPENVNTKDMGNLGLTPQEVAAVVAFLNTLTDGWKPETGP
jgi:cytochrome c peroxidase